MLNGVASWWNNQSTTFKAEFVKAVRFGDLLEHIHLQWGHPLDLLLGLNDPDVKNLGGRGSRQETEISARNIAHLTLGSLVNFCVLESVWVQSFSCQGPIQSWELKLLRIYQRIPNYHAQPCFWKKHCEPTYLNFEGLGKGWRREVRCWQISRKLCVSLASFNRCQ